MAYLNHMKEELIKSMKYWLVMVFLLSKKHSRSQRMPELDVYNQIKGIQPICFENACWAYIVGAAIAIKKGCRQQQKLQQQSEKDFRLSVFLDQLLIREK